MKNNRKRKFPQEEPSTQNDMNNKNLEYPFEAPAPFTKYDYGRPHYTDENHVKHLLFDDRNIGNMADDAKTSLFHQD